MAKHLNIRFSFGGTYQAIQQPDGTWSIPKVHVFQRGNHKGCEFDDTWLDEALGQLSQFKEESGVPAHHCVRQAQLSKS